MIGKPIQEVREADILSLIEQGREEGTQLDFKRDLPKDDHDGRKAFYSDICAFANTSGGDLIYGLDEENGIATTIVSQVLPMSADSYVLKLTSSIRDRIEPVLHGVHIHVVSLTEGGHSVIIRVPRSYSGIHRYKSDGQFYIRKSRSNEQLDVPGIVSRVADRLGHDDRVTSFFARRYADILSNEHALALAAGPKLVVHVVPVRDFLSGEEVDLDAVLHNSPVPLLTETSGHSQRNVFDGRAFFDTKNNVANVFTLFMRSGVVEACMDIIGLDWPDDYQKVDLGYVETSVLRFLSMFQSSDIAERTTGIPYLVKVALLGTNGLPFASGARSDIRSNPNGLPVRQPLAVLALPVVLIEEAAADLVHEMHSAFVRMWHAWAYQKSYFYELDEGRWVRKP